MSIELKYLAYTALLTASLWIPYVVAQVRTNGPLIPENYVDPKQRPLPLWGQRAYRAHLNAVETFFSVMTRQRIRRGSFHSCKPPSTNTSPSGTPSRDRSFGPLRPLPSSPSWPGYL